MAKVKKGRRILHLWVPRLKEAIEAAKKEKETLEDVLKIDYR